MTKTAIEWAERVWNPVTGCTKVSPGCANCYAERLFPRVYPGREFSEVRVHEDRLYQPYSWRDPARVFVCSMGDLFHESVGRHAVLSIFRVMRACPEHVFLLLTKRPVAAMRFLMDYRDRWHGPGWVFPNIWLGVSVENSEQVSRIHWIRDAPTAGRFVSFEPLLGPIVDVDLTGIGWAIVGGESGPKARPMAPNWVRFLRELCVGQSVPFFFKQWGGLRAKSGGRELDGREWSEYPDFRGG